MRFSLPTVRVKHKGGYKVINQSDYDEEKHTLYTDPPPKKRSKASGDEPPPDASNAPPSGGEARYVVKPKPGGWFDVVDAENGEAQNAKSLREDEAQALAAKLNAA